MIVSRSKFYLNFAVICTLDVSLCISNSSLVNSKHVFGSEPGLKKMFESQFSRKMSDFLGFHLMIANNTTSVI